MIMMIITLQMMLWKDVPLVYDTTVASGDQSVAEDTSNILTHERRMFIAENMDNTSSSNVDDTSPPNNIL